MRRIRVPQMADFIARQYRAEPGRALFFWGPPGVGKTMMVGAVAREMGIGFKETRIGTMVPSDLRGVPVPDRERRITEWFTGEYLPDPERDGEKGILLLDEYPQATPIMQGLAQRLVLERRMGERYRLPDGWMVVALGNRREDHASVYEMPTQTQNRFKHFLVEPDIRSFTDYAMRRNFHPHIVSFLNANESYLFMFDSQAKNSPAWPSPRTWEYANADYSLSEDAADLEQSVGSKAMDQFLAYRTVFASLPDVRAILAGSGVQEELPVGRNAQFALIIALASGMASPDEGVNAYRWLVGHSLDGELLQVYLEYIVRRARDRGETGALAQMISAEPSLQKSIEELLAALMAG
ncbi:MAG: AAA family ATPase [Truepera sp.]|nr:AAA family ATPase [Truepera sp.]